MQKIFAPAGNLGFGDPDGVSTRHRKIFSATGCSDGGCGSR